MKYLRWFRIMVVSLAVGFLAGGNILWALKNLYGASDILSNNCGAIMFMVVTASFFVYGLLDEKKITVFTTLWLMGLLVSLALIVFGFAHIFGWGIINIAMVLVMLVVLFITVLMALVSFGLDSQQE